MKELIEKIKKEIKKKIESYMDLQCDFEDHEMSYQEEILDNHYEGCKSGLETAIDIINKEAKSYNNGWIPCSERLPENYGTYLCCDKYGNFILGYPIARVSSNNFYVETECEIMNDCIAWQPLPPAYVPKEGRE